MERYNVHTWRCWPAHMEFSSHSHSPADIIHITAETYFINSYEAKARSPMLVMAWDKLMNEQFQIHI